MDPAHYSGRALDSEPAGDGGQAPFLRDVARFRQGAYRLLSASLQFPEADSLSRIREAAATLRSMSNTASSLAFYADLDRLLQRLQSLDETSIDELQRLHVRLFGGSSVRKSIPLSESGYLDPISLETGQVFADLQSHYAYAGVTQDGASRGEPPDHITVELEFLSALCGQEADRWDEGDTARARRITKREGRFLEEHPCQWLPQLAQALGTRDRGLYALTATAIWSMVAHDVDFVHSLDLFTGSTDLNSVVEEVRA